MKRRALLLPPALLLAAALGSQDWPMLGGAPERNGIAAAGGPLPAAWDVETGANVKWSAALGEQTYGNPVIAGGKVFVGTNNAAPRDPRVTGDKGVLMAFREADGAFLWQAVTDKRGVSDQDWPQIGVTSAPAVVGDRLYYVTNRGELVALDVEGFRDQENDGPVQTEARTSPADADVVWSRDLPAELKVVPRFAASSAPAVHGDLLFVHTGNGVGEGGKVPAPKAPSFLAVDRKTGKTVWSDASPGAALVAGQWSSPAVGSVGGVLQAVFGGGDGWLYGFEAATGKLLWKLDAAGHQKLPPGAGRNAIVATPVLHGGRAYVGVGQDPQLGEAPGALWAVDATKRGDLTQSPGGWRYDKLGRTLSAVAIHDGLLYAADLQGFLHCLDLATGRPLWTHDLFAAVWSTPLVADGKVYLTDEDGDVAVLRAGRKLEVLAEINMGRTVTSSAVAANGTLYVATGDRLYALAPGAKPPQPAAKKPAG